MAAHYDRAGGRGRDAVRAGRIAPSQWPVTDDSLARLARGTQLRVLYLEGDDAIVTEQCLAPLASLVHLQRLSVLRLRTLAGPGLSSLVGLRNLRRVSFEDCPQIGDEVLGPL